MSKKGFMVSVLGIILVLPIITVSIVSYAALNPVQGADIGLEVRAPAGQLVFFDVVTTGADGCAQTSFTIGSAWPDGTYTVYGAASGYGVANQTTFGVNTAPSSPTYSTPINYVLELSTDQQVYSQGDPVTITACLYEIVNATTTTPPPTTTPPTTTTPTATPPAAVGGVVDSGYSMVRPLVVGIAVVLLALGAILLTRRS